MNDAKSISQDVAHRQYVPVKPHDTSVLSSANFILLGQNIWKYKYNILRNVIKYNFLYCFDNSLKWLHHSYISNWVTCNCKNLQFEEISSKQWCNGTPNLHTSYLTGFHISQPPSSPSKWSKPTVELKKKLCQQSHNQSWPSPLTLHFLQERFHMRANIDWAEASWPTCQVCTGVIFLERPDPAGPRARDTQKIELTSRRGLRAFVIGRRWPLASATAAEAKRHDGPVPFWSLLAECLLLILARRLSESAVCWNTRWRRRPANHQWLGQVISYRGEKKKRLIGAASKGPLTALFNTEPEYQQLKWLRGW